MTGTPQPHPPKQLRHGRRREATLWVPWRTFLVRELEDRFLRIVCCGRVVYRGNVLFGTVCSPPLVTYQCYLPLWLSSILTLAITRHWNPLPTFQGTRLRVSIWRTGLYWVVTFQRMCVSMSDRTHIYLILIMTPRLYMLAAMTLNLWILIVIVRQKGPRFDPPLTFHAGHVPGPRPVHHRIYRNSGVYG